MVTSQQSRKVFREIQGSGDIGSSLVVFLFFSNYTQELIACVQLQARNAANKMRQQFSAFVDF